MNDYIKEAQALIHEKLGLQKRAASPRRKVSRGMDYTDTLPPVDYQPAQHSPEQQKVLDDQMKRNFKEPGSYKRLLAPMPDGWIKNEAIQRGKALDIYTDPVPQPAPMTKLIDREGPIITQGREQGYEYLPWLHKIW